MFAKKIFKAKNKKKHALIFVKGAGGKGAPRGDSKCKLVFFFLPSSHIHFIPVTPPPGRTTTTTTTITITTTSYFRQCSFARRKRVDHDIIIIIFSRLPFQSFHNAKKKKNRKLKLKGG